MARKALLGQLSDSDIRLLRVFKAIAECGGFSAAELELNINRSTISRHIKDLEIRLGVTLCRRGRGGFALTAEGKEIYQSTLRLMAALDDFRSDVNEVHQQLTGTLTLAFFDKLVSNPKALVAATLREFDQIAPEVQLEIYVEPTNEIERGVMEGRFHLGIIPMHRPSSSMAYHPLFEEQMYLYCGARHPLFQREPASLQEQDILDCKYAGLGYHSPNMQAGHALNMTRSATAYDQEAVAHLILSGCYLGYLPDHFAEPLQQAGLVKPVLPTIYQYRCEFNAIVRQSPKPSRMVQTFLSTLTRVHQSGNQL